jgi:Caspase domain
MVTGNVDRSGVGSTHQCVQRRHGRRAVNEDCKRTALLIGCPLGLDGVGNDIDNINARLVARGFTCRRCHGEDATRDRILAELECLRAGARLGHAIVFYYSGHGGRCHLAKHEHATHEVGSHNYLVPVDHDEEGEFRGVVDFELSMAFHDITTRTKNVTVILDCCHAATLVRGSQEVIGAQPDERTKRWKGRSLYRMPHDLRKSFALFERRRHELHPESNPHVVRVVATGAGSPAFESQQAGGYGGWLTSELCAALDDELGARTSWDRIIRRVREQVMRHRGNAHQHPEVEGPVARFPFSLEEEVDVLNRTTLVYDPTDGRSWVRAGRLHGLEVGDELRVLRDDGHASQGQVAARARVVKVLDDLARVELSAARAMAPPGTGSERGFPPNGSTVALGVLGRRELVWVRSVDHAVLIEHALELRPRLQLTDDPNLATFRVIQRGGWISIEGPSWLHRRARRADANGIISLVDDLDDLAKRLVLDERLAHPTGLPKGASWSADLLVRRPGERTFRVLRDPTLLTRGTEAYIELEVSFSTLPALYVNVLDRGVSGRIQLLNESQPSGIELRVGLGARTNASSRASARVPGLSVLTLDWPSDVPLMPELSEEFIIVASTRPLDLRPALAIGQVSRRRSSTARTAMRNGAKHVATSRDSLAPRPLMSLGTALEWDIRRTPFGLAP